MEKKKRSESKVSLEEAGAGRVERRRQAKTDGKMCDIEAGLRMSSKSSKRLYV